MRHRAHSRVALRVLSGDLQGQVFRIDDELIVGRSTTCAVFVPDRRISREHSRFVLEGDDLFVEDLQSHNGTFVNGQRIERIQLFHGDLVRLGTSQFAVEAYQRHDSASIRVIQDEMPLHPRHVWPVQPISTRLDSVNAAALFDAIGASETDRFPSAEKLDKLRQQTRNFAILHEISKALQPIAELGDMMPGLMDLVLQVVNGDRGAVVLLDEDGELVPRTVRYRDGTGPTSPEAELTLSKTVADWVLKERCGIITADASSDDRFSAAESVVLNNLRSLLVVPVQVGERLLGLIQVEHHRTLEGFDENDLHLMMVIASMLGIAIENIDMTRARERAIVQLQAAQEQLLATQERLVVSERMGMLGRLASGIAHEVKNHLSPFMLADMIARKYEDDQEIQEAAELMLEAQQRILSLVDEIRSFAAGGLTSVNIAPHDLAGVIEGVLRFLRCDRAVKLADIRFEPTERPIVFMDAHRIRQVLINLIRNAVDAVQPTGGKIGIRLSTTAAHAIVQVHDNGRGIPAEFAARVFEPFFSTKGDKGLGLGLDISRQITLAHGGTLTFESTEGEGTEFRMCLPLTAVDAESALPQDPTGDFKSAVGAGAVP
jgi:signal transduction histidine kinase/pSer/pThr/pTyr-binding forkhead associated (FHA) protein